jgi:hypothetical protein
MYFPLFVFFVSAFAVFWLSAESHLKNTGDGSSYSSPQTYFVCSDVFYLACLFFGFRSFLTLSTRKPAYWTSLLMVISITSWIFRVSFDDVVSNAASDPFFRPCSPSLSTGWWRVSSNDLQLSPHGITSFGILVLGSRFFTSRKCEVVCFLSFFLPLILQRFF